MLVPAIIHKEKLLSLFAKDIYTEKYYYYYGYLYGHELPDIDVQNCKWNYAIMQGDDIIGYLSYRINDQIDSIKSFGLYSFDQGNPVLGRDLINKMDELVKKHHRIEWRVIDGNPVKRHYDEFCKKHNGNIITLHDTCLDFNGNYRNSYIYEIIRKERSK